MSHYNNGLHWENCVTLEKVGHIWNISSSHLELLVTLRNVGPILQNVGHTWKNEWRLQKIGHTRKNGSYLEKCVAIKKMSDNYINWSLLENRSRLEK